MPVWEDNVTSSQLVKLLLGMVAALFIGAPSVNAQSSSGLFAGKTVSILIGFSPGGSNDVWARVMSKHFGKHLPGNPTIVVQNFPGAGGLRLMNELYNASPKDGTVLGLVNRGLAFEPLLGGANTRFDATKMNWIGSPDRDITICVARKDAPVQTMQDLFSKTLVVGATGSGADTAIYPQFLSELLGMKFKIVLGYPGSKEISVAMERNEVEGICVAYESAMRQNLARQGQLNILFQAALQPDSRMKDVPVGTDLARSEQDRAVLKLFFARVAMGRPIVAPPGVDPERVAALRKGFDDMMKDEAFLAEAKAIDPAQIASGTLRAAYAIAREALESDIQTRVCRNELWNFSQMTGWQGSYGYLVTIQPVGTPELREQALARWRAFPTYLDTEIANAREGLRLKYTAPKLNVRIVIGQVDALLAESESDSPFTSPAARDKDPEFSRAFRAIYRESLVPAFKRYRDFLEREYLPAARDDIAVAFRELLMNAIEHGGKHDPRKRVRVSIIQTARALMVWIDDPGKGFSLDFLPHAAISNPEDSPIRHAEVRAEAGQRPGGFGILMTRNLVDEMMYNERGNAVLFVKYLR